MQLVWPQISVTTILFIRKEEFHAKYPANAGLKARTVVAILCKVFWMQFGV